jgi:hypothetical protein
MDIANASGQIVNSHGVAEVSPPDDVPMNVDSVVPPVPVVTRMVDDIVASKVHSRG